MNKTDPSPSAKAAAEIMELDAKALREGDEIWTQENIATIIDRHFIKTPAEQCAEELVTAYSEVLHILRGWMATDTYEQTLKNQIRNLLEPLIVKAKAQS